MAVCHVTRIVGTVTLSAAILCSLLARWRVRYSLARWRVFVSSTSVQSTVSCWWSQHAAQSVAHCFKYLRRQTTQGSRAWQKFGDGWRFRRFCVCRGQPGFMASGSKFSDVGLYFKSRSLVLLSGNYPKPGICANLVLAHGSVRGFRPLGLYNSAKFGEAASVVQWKAI